MSTAMQLLPEHVEESYLPKVLPAGWVRIEHAGPAFDCFSNGPSRGLRVLMSVGIEADGCVWIHVSVSRPSRCPSWEDMDAVKRIFIGDSRYAYQIHPPRSSHYTLSGKGSRVGTVLHLWSPADGSGRTPDFLGSRGGTI